MKKIVKEFIKKIILLIDDKIFRYVVKWLYPQYKRRRYGYMLNIRVLLKYAIFQKIFRINGSVPWPVHFTSQINGWEYIEKGICCDPGDSIGIYINAYGGLKLGNNVAIGANTTITTTNHHPLDQRKTASKKGIVIGDNVWIGANCSILAGVTIGNNVVIGAGVVVRENIPDNSIVKTKEDIFIRIEKIGKYKWDVLKEELN
jgi:acetyltransferase-like isoleucine patch superfamily enzyme